MELFLIRMMGRRMVMMMIATHPSESLNWMALM